MANLFVTTAQLAGVNIQKFGDSKNPLPEVFA
jgi:hypothetical protein